ncbi:hypothetical protein [Thermosyntropha sp.]|uniref:hypothetical protein n=1 Tax=Thermosyntropha sp. TaxID=2740820 RepID=UPI0025F9CD6C|nr:hypothetical protein [Thermosyntropha sp.]MBO8158443.1 hypothetical protein [Thermosyntropha sp.]
MGLLVLFLISIFPLNALANVYTPLSKEVKNMLGDNPLISSTGVKVEPWYIVPDSELKYIKTRNSPNPYYVDPETSKIYYNPNFNEKNEYIGDLDLKYIKEPITELYFFEKSTYATPKTNIRWRTKSFEFLVFDNCGFTRDGKFYSNKLLYHSEPIQDIEDIGTFQPSGIVDKGSCFFMFHGREADGKAPSSI